ncbi:MAG: flagellar assembly protein FliH [Desulfovibrionaceae bacterium]|nr:flagellar assembly protein FliH [Desulfovibrionaceae bacterium]
MIDAKRKQWGTVFMGAKEATLEQLGAMQEPLLRERAQKEQEGEYLERVRQRACDRAREILSEAYTERQKILNDAQAEADAFMEKVRQDVEVIKAEAVKLHAEAKADVERSKQVLQDAEHIKAQAHDEGYQAGMDQAGQELREFRADLGSEMAQVLRHIAGEISSITQFWREDLAELVRQAVVSGTGWVLDQNYEVVLKSLVLQAITLLEEREVVTLRVNPEDEAIVSDLFRAAREKAPELKQWIVNGDDSIERGGLVAESGSGSVDLKRQNFRNLVNDILEHLTLPKTPEERARQEQATAQILSAAQKFEADLSMPLTPVDKEPSANLADFKPAEPMSDAQVAEPQIAHQASYAGQAVTLAEPSIDDQPFEPAPKPMNMAQDLTEQAQPELTVEEPRQAVVLDNEPEAEPDLPLPTLDLPDNPEEEVAAPTQADPQLGTSLADLEEELFPVGQDEESEILANGGFLPELTPNK